MQKWEYCVKQFNIRFGAEKVLNELGNEGWELFGIYEDCDEWYVVCKRPKNM